jgi:ABC-type transport system involved in multi-copper enzyme maturation permease subunit
MGDEQKSERSVSRMKKYLPFAAGVLILLIIGALVVNFGLNGNTGTGTSYPGGSGNTATDTGKGVSEGVSDGSSQSQSASQTASSDAQFDISKIIYSGSISLYTEDYKGTFEKVGAYASSIGGFVENSSSSYLDKVQNTTVNSGYITVRVPAARYQEAMKEIQKFGTPANASTSSTNISQQYQDVKGQLDNLKIEQERLQGYLAKAENIQDLLAIEKELNRVKTEIDNRTTLLNNWDKEIAYSTIYVSITEKKLATSTVQSPFSDMFQKIKEGFIGSINLLLNFTAWIIVFVVSLLPFAAVAGGGYYIFRRVSRKKKQ